MDSSMVRGLLASMRSYRWILPLLLMLGLSAFAAEGLSIGVLIPIFASSFLASHEQAFDSGILAVVNDYASRFDEEYRLVVLALTASILIVLRSVVIYAYNAVSSWTTHQHVHRLNLRLSRKLLTSNVLNFSEQEPSRWIHAAAEGWQVGEVLAILFSMLIRLCVIVVFTILLLLVSWHLTTVIAAAVLTMFLLTRQLAKRADRVGVAAVRANQDFTQRLVEMLNGMRLIRAFGQERREEASFAEASDRARAAGFRLDLVVNAIDPLLEVLYIPMLVGTLAYAMAAGMSIPTAFAFLLLLYRLQPHVRALDSDRVRLARHAPAVREVFGLLSRPDQQCPLSGPVPCPAFLDSIEFREVVYAYRGRGDASALHRVSFTIRRGQMTAVVGKSGAGKSTLINLLMRFDDPCTGEILVDGVPLRQLNLGDWRRRLALAGQAIDLMGGTIFENITYGRADADHITVQHAARDAYAHGFIAEFEAGYDTVVGGRGATLSGGQRQRIGLARAFVRDPDILILDEATSSLDSLSEVEVQAALARFRRNQKTVIVITHRLSTVSAADQVIVLDRGRIVQIGTPEQLLEQNGVFAELHQAWWLRHSCRGISRAASLHSEPSAAGGDGS